MSGPNQHFIPRFHQRAFGVPRRGKPYEIWEYRRGVAPELNTIKAAGAEPHFYSSPADADPVPLDDRITALETPLARNVKTLRDLPPGTPVQADVAREILFHLVPRTRHVRSLFSDAIGSLVDGASTLLDDPDAVLRLAGLDQASINDRFRSEIMARFASDRRFAQLDIPGPLLERILFQMAKEAHAAGLLPRMDDWKAELGTISRDVKPLARDGHRELVSQILEKGFARQDIDTFDWSMEAGPPEGAVLPDSIAIGYDADGAAGPLLLAGKGRLTAVVMPLAPDRLLVGRRPGDWAMRPDTINADLAACAETVLAPCGARYAHLAAGIGIRSERLLQDIVATALSRIDVPRAETEDEPAADPSDPSDHDIQHLRYPVEFPNWPDADLAQRVADDLNHLTTQLSRIVPLQRLEGVTVALDFPAAVAAVNRGRKDLSPARAKTDGPGLAKCVAVIRDGMVKWRLVLSADLALTLSAQDTEAQLWAAHAICTMLAQIGFLEVMDTTVPGVLLQPLEDLPGRLYAAGSSALETFAGAREVNFIGPHDEIMAGYADHLHAALGRMIGQFPKARLSYRYDADLDRLLDTALATAGDVMAAAAALIGHADQVELAPWRQGELALMLEKSGLSHWIETLERDLTVFYARLGRWTGCDEFLAFNRHIERLLWQMGVFPWETGEDGYRIEVPLDIDAIPLLRDLIEGRAQDVALTDDQRRGLGLLLSAAEQQAATAPPSPLALTGFTSEAPLVDQGPLEPQSATPSDQ